MSDVPYGVQYDGREEGGGAEHGEDGGVAANLRGDPEYRPWTPIPRQAPPQERGLLPVQRRRRV